MKPLAWYYAGRVEVDARGIHFETFYWPIGGKRVEFAEIECAIIYEPADWLNRYRVHALGSRESYLPIVWQPPTDGQIIEIVTRGAWQRIGFTVREGDGVEEALRARVKVKDVV